MQNDTEPEPETQRYNLGSYIGNTTVMEKGTGVEATTSSMQLTGADEELKGNASILLTVETFLRLLPIGLCVTALVIMLKNSQENEYGSIAYTDLGAFRQQCLAVKGDTATTWSSACGSFGPFCHKVTASLAVTFVAVVCYVVLSLISSYKLFSKYDAPVSNSTKGIDNAAFHG